MSGPGAGAQGARPSAADRGARPGAAEFLRRWLAHPLTRGLPLDHPHTTALRRQIIRAKPFLLRIYEEWYERIVAALPPGPGVVLELGSGAGFLETRLPGVITSEVFLCPGTAAALDATALPVPAGSLRAIAMVDVLHHVPWVGGMLREAARAVRPGGRLIAIEPWVTGWSRFIYGRFHHEPFEPGARDWELPPGGPLSVANGALPWIVLERDRERFARELPEWRLATIEPMMPFRYLVSGGVGLRGLVPAATYPLWRGLERALGPLRHRLAMFALIVLERRPHHRS